MADKVSTAAFAHKRRPLLQARPSPLKQSLIGVLAVSGDLHQCAQLIQLASKSSGFNKFFRIKVIQ